MPKLAMIEKHPPGVVAQWRERAAERKQNRLVSGRVRRSLAASARRAATASARTRHTVLLQDRAAAVRDELLELALILEHADQRDVSWIFAIHKLLTDGCESPLFNPAIHMSELRATLYYLRSEPEFRTQRRPVTPVAPGSPR